MTEIIDALTHAIYDHLHGSSAVTTLLSSSTAIYYGLAPANGVLPYVVYSLAGGGDDHLTPQASVDVKYTIKGVARTAQDAGAIAGVLRTALHEVEPSTESPWTIYRCQADGMFMYPENTAKEQFWHAGDIYRIRATK
jgi:hypothetical protein